MKVLSIQEPYATLIKNKTKMIETRSWKTNYRGELYIHASISNAYSKSEKVNQLALLVDLNKLNFGKIICRCQLVDCIYMTEEYIKKIKNNNYQEYMCGQYEIGRYAWILEKVEPLNNPIPTKGQLNIWNYYNQK